MSLTTRDIEHARQRVANMTPSQLLTRLNRITKPEKLHAFSAAVIERIKTCKSEFEVRIYYSVLVRINARQGSNTLDVDYYLGKFQVTKVPDKPTVKKVIVKQSVIQLPKVKKKVSRRNLGI